MGRQINVEEIMRWAEDTVKVYNHEAETVKEYGYYTQTPLSLVSQSPDMLILGINPGSVGGKKNMTAEELLKGNPCFKGLDKKSIVKSMIDGRWALWHRLNNMLGNSSNNKNLLQDFDKFVLSNMIFFGTSKENLIPKGIDKKKCAERTLKLIEYLEPKVVVLLGKQSRDLFNRITNQEKLEVLVPNSIYHCIYGESHVLAIKHTAYHYSYQEMVVVGKTIGYVLDHHDETINKDTISASYIKEDITRFEERQKVKQPRRKKKVDSARIIESVTLCKDFQLTKIENTSERYNLSDSLMLTITKTGKGYIAIRHKVFNGKNPYPNSKYELTDEYRDLLNKLGWNCHTKDWIAFKLFDTFGDSENEIVNKIITDLDIIVKNVR